MVRGERKEIAGRTDRQGVAVADSQEEALNQRKIFVGGLAHKTTKNNLRDYFGRFGAVVDAVVLRWSDGRSRGFGYVTFAEVESIDRVLAETHHIGGRQVEVKRAVPGTNKLFVGGLPQNTTGAELRAYFERFGVVSDAVVMIDPQTKRSRGFGFICFLPGPEGGCAIDAALGQYQEHRIRGKWIEVKSAAPPHKCSKEEALPVAEKARVAAGGQAAAKAGSQAQQDARHHGAMARQQATGLGRSGPAASGLQFSAGSGEYGWGDQWMMDPQACGYPWPSAALQPELASQWSLVASLNGYGSLPSLLAPATQLSEVGATQQTPGLASPKKVQISSHIASWGADMVPEEEVQVAFAASGDLQKGLEQLLRTQLGVPEGAEVRTRTSTSTSASEDNEPTTKTEV